MDFETKFNEIAIVALIFLASVVLLFSNIDHIDSVDELKLVSEEGYFVLSKNGVQKEFSDSVEKKLNWYTDALCPDCHRVFNEGFDTLYQEVLAGDMEIKFHPINFLPQYSDNDWPLKGAAWTLGVAENQPEKVVEFMKALNADTETDLSKKSINYLEGLSKEVEIDNEAINSIKKNMFFWEAIVNGASVGIREDKELIEKSGEFERMFVPFIYLNDRKALNGETDDVSTDILDELLDGFTPCGPSDCE